MSEIDLALSKQIAKKIKATPQQCYYNAYKALSKLPEEAQYVEGYAIIASDPLPIEHGWLEVDGKIVDPTLAKPGLVYFPGLRFDGVLGVKQAMGDRLELPIFYRFGWGGSHSPEMMTAYKAALEYGGLILTNGSEPR